VRYASRRPAHAPRIGRVRRRIGALATLLLAFGASCLSLPYSEHSPTVSADGRILIYQSNYLTIHKYKLFVKYRTRVGWTPAFMMVDVGSSANDGGPFITYDQNNLLLSSTRRGGIGSIDIWTARRLGPIWTIPDNIGAPINSPAYDGFASLSPDGSTMYLVRECPDKRLARDERFGIFVARKIDDAWSAPVKMPAPINSEHSEFSPLILADGATLIFSSDRPGGRGGYDLYQSRYVNGRWSAPVSMDFINTPEDDRLVSVPASGDIIYYSRPIVVEGQTVYRITSAELPARFRPAPVALVHGTVFDLDAKEACPGAAITITDVRGTVAPVHIHANQKDGRFVAILNRGRLYDVSVAAKGYTFRSERIDLRALTKYASVEKDITLRRLRPGATMVLNTLYFAVNSARLLPESVFELRRVIELMNAYPSMSVSISGHTDSTGVEEANVRLSRDRALSVARHLAANGIAAGRITTKGFGSSKPVSPNDTDENRRANRRVEFTVETM